MMNFLISLIVTLIFCSTSFAQVSIPFPGPGGVASGTVYGCPTCVVDLRCEDNAADTVVTNSGTGAAWIASVNTNTITSTEKVEGSRSFLLDASLDRIYRASNWTSEKFEVTFYMKLVSASAPGTTRVIWSLSSGTILTLTSDSIILNRRTDNALSLLIKGTGGTGYTWISTNWTVDTNWHKYTITVDASTAPWTSVVVKQGDTTLTWDISDLPTAAANFNTPHFIGVNVADRQIDAYFDVITIKDNT